MQNKPYKIKKPDIDTLETALAMAESLAQLQTLQKFKTVPNFDRDVFKDSGYDHCFYGVT